MSDTPVSFGYKTAWLAIRNADQASVIRGLGLSDATPTTWAGGLDLVYKGGKEQVLVTPAVAGEWTIVVGHWSFPDDQAQVDELGRRITELSALFGEVQAFASHRVIEYHHWMVARRGSLVRAFAYIGESGEVLTTTGEITAVEQSYPWADLDTLDWTPDESHVMEVAAAWSVDPTDIDSYEIAQGPTLIARTGHRRP